MPNATPTQAATTDKFGPHDADAVADKLYDLLQSRGAVIVTFEYPQFKEFCNRKRLTKKAYNTIDESCASSGLAVAFGRSAVLIGMDQNFAPKGLGNR